MQRIDRKLIVEAYRNLYKTGLRAVAHSAPARFVVKAHIERAFRNGDPANYDQTRINNTVGFLHQASLARGIEHKIIKNLIHVHYYERENNLHAKPTLQGQPEKGKITWHSQERKDGYRSFYNALEVFNDNHQLCLI